MTLGSKGKCVGPRTSSRPLSCPTSRKHTCAIKTTRPQTVTLNILQKIAMRMANEQGRPELAGPIYGILLMYAGLDC